MNAIIPDLIIQTGHHSPDEHLLAGCDHLADTKTLNASKNHYLPPLGEAVLNGLFP
jgi:hypothetical protein